MSNGILAQSLGGGGGNGGFALSAGIGVGGGGIGVFCRRLWRGGWKRVDRNRDEL